MSDLDRAACGLLCRRRPVAVLLAALSILCGPLIVVHILALCNASVTIPPQYTATLLSSADFTYNLTAHASAEFSLWAYVETRHFTNTSTASGAQDPDNPWTYYHFVSTFQTGCSYYGYPLVLGVGKGVNYGREPQGNNSLQLTSPGCAAMVAIRALGIASCPMLLFNGALTSIMLMCTLSWAVKLERGELPASTDLDKEFALSRVGRAMLGITTAVCVPLLVCLLVWAYSPAFTAAGGQWDANLYLFLAVIAFIFVVQWLVNLYDMRVEAQVRRKVLV